LANDVTVFQTFTNSATLNLATTAMRTINGAFAQTGGGTLMLAVTTSGAAELNITGAATLGGTLDLVFAPGSYTNQSYDLIAYRSETGTFATITGTTAPSNFASSM